MNLRREFHGPNVAYLLELLERFQHEPESLDTSTRHFVQQHQAAIAGLARENGRAAPRQAGDGEIEIIMGTVNLAQAIREFGHLNSQLDPLGSPPPGEPSLDAEYHSLSDADLRRLPASLIGGPAAEGAGDAFAAIGQLREIYSSTIGYDYDHLRDHEERFWLRTTAESRRFRPPQTALDLTGLLEQLTQVDVFEQFLHRVFPGKTRFSVEGLDMLVPVLNEIVGRAAEAGIRSILLGMAHRGRLNVMTHVLQRPYAQILTMFKDPAQRESYDRRNIMGWTGDVKYHAGDRHAIDREQDEVIDLVVKLAPNPSHLEHINPVVLGMARAAGTSAQEPGRPLFRHATSLPLLIHGDASFPAQGIVAETLNMHRLPGYRVGGTIHIIANNQIGFTTDDEEGRSTLYASDLAKGFKIPIVHVNADDPLACIEVARTAFAYRRRFQKDFLIDLIGYRRYGHNEGDEPRFTQPLMYHKIEKHPTVRELLADSLMQEGRMSSDETRAIETRYLSQLQELYESLEVEHVADEMEPQLELPPSGAARAATTAVSLRTLHDLNRSLLELPDGFQLDKKLARAHEKRGAVLNDPDDASVDWAAAEELALASILAEGTAVRLTGEDVARGTFSQRHAVFHDSQSGDTYCPLQTIPQASASFEIHNSPLSENAAVGFEYGYNIQAPQRLVLWEAQYGDFVNTAQAMIDEFLVAGKAKWEQTPSLVLLLPHGYEGQGPDHSTARLERFLQLAANTSIRITYPTTAAQYFHLLRRQKAVLETDPLPLVVLTPKSLLRHPRAASTPRQLAEGGWQPVISQQVAPEEVRRLILCTGKVYMDLLEAQAQSRNDANESTPLAIIRIEQLYPFPEAAVRDELSRYQGLRDVIWLQEEPANMGAWEFVRPYLNEVIDGRLPLEYIGRPRRSSPAEGSTTWHKRNQQKIMEQALHFADKRKVETT